METRDKDTKFREALARMSRKSAERMEAQKPPKETKPESLVGWGLGPRVADILNGTVKEECVQTIFVIEIGTEWDELISDCRKTYWIQNPDKGEAVARRLKEAGKIKESMGGRGNTDWMNMEGVAPLKRSEAIDEIKVSDLD